MNNFTINVREAKVASGVVIGQAFVVEAKQVKNCRVKVVEVNAVFR